MEKNNTKAISKVLDASRRKLLDTGIRNRLIHVNRENLRSNCLNIVNERTDQLYAILRAQGKRMRFKPMGKDKVTDDGDVHLATPETALPLDSDRLTDSFVETPLGPEALARRLLRLAGDAKTAEEEQGVNILYLAMGFLRWSESPSSELIREAPLILLPVQLQRNERTSTYDLLCRDEDLTTNLPLAERLRQDFGIVLPEIEESEEWTPSNYFALIADAVSAKQGWAVEPDAMQLGFFSFAKLLMHRDLDPAAWPAAELSGNPLLKGLLADGFPEEEPLFHPTDKLDDKLDPADIIHVIDADVSQTKVIEEVRKGCSLVVQGPPGTGKSQTITNIIAAAAHDGKTVLFVAEKMAALSVVHDRLVKAGLQDICLELHSRSANKKALAQELARTLMASARTLPRAADATRLRKTRDELNCIAAMLHTPAPGMSETPFQAISEIIGFIGCGAPPPVIASSGLELLDREQRAKVVNAVANHVAALRQLGDPAAHPFRGTSELALQPTDLARLASELDEGIAATQRLTQELDNIARSARLTQPGSIDEARSLVAGLAQLALAPEGVGSLVRLLYGEPDHRRLLEALEAGQEWAEAFEAGSPRFVPAAWTTPVAALRPLLMRGHNSWLARLFGPYRRASAELAALLTAPLPKRAAERLLLLDELVRIQLLRERLANDEAWLKSRLDTEWRGERTPFARLLASAQWLATLRGKDVFVSAEQLTMALESLPDPAARAATVEHLITGCIAGAGVPIARLKLDIRAADIGPSLESAPLAEMASAFRQMATSLDGYNDWVEYQRSTQQLQHCGAAVLLAAVAEGKVEPQHAQREFVYACAEARWNAARQAEPALSELSRLDRHDLVRVFGTLEKERIETAKTLILSRHFEQMPKGTMGEMGIIRGEIGRKRGHKPIRWVMQNAGRMIQRIKPVMLMSPISVAQFLPSGSVSFDLLVIDEASQIRPEDALGVIARARQIVVVGDQKQLPPTSFFDRLVDDAETNDEDDETIGATAADMESILSLCEARGLRQRMLQWHYRSRDPSLIQVSNAEFYRDDLVLPPSPLQLDPNYGLKFTKVPGVYARGGSGLGRQGTNRIEAEAVAAAVAAHARQWPDLSLGVVAFSKAQADMLTEVLELQRRKDLVLDAFLREGKSEDVFVKNIENVQGDERDVILISVGYGPQEPNGRLNTMSFGPINGEGGERRLNVLFSRARVRCEVFASFEPGDIDPGRVRRDGPRVLKRFLDFASTGIMDTPGITGIDTESPFEADVAQVIQSFGYIADPQVGTSGFRIDIGVRHPERPGQYLMAVECDGAAYHSALWARERDRHRQGILENLGWRFHRIWSTDWFHNRAREIERLKAALEHARGSAASGLRILGSNTTRNAPTTASPELEPAELTDISHLTLAAPAYVRADIVIKSALQPHETPVQQLTELVMKIVAIEGPIHEDEIARRVTGAFGLARTGHRIVEATNRAIGEATEINGKLKRHGPFIATQEQFAKPPIRDRSAESGTLLKAEYLSPHEIAAAARQIVSDSGAMPPAEMAKAVSRLLGYQRIGPDLAEAITQSLPG